MHRFTCAARFALAICILAAAPMSRATAQEIVEPDRPISLQEAIQIALQNQGNVQATEESIVVARQGVIQAAAGLKPLVRAGADFSASGSTNLAGVFGPTPISTSTSLDKGIKPFVRATQTFFDGGITRLQLRQARTGVESAEARLQGVRNDLAFNVSGLYLAQLRAQAVLALRNEQIRQAEQQLQDVEERIRVGTLAAVERFLPQSQLELNRVEKIRAENALKVAAIALRNTLGLPPGPPLRLVEPVQHPEEYVLPPLTELQDRAMRQRPEVIQSEASMRIQQAAVSLARLNRTLLPNGQLAATFVPADDLQKASGSVSLSVQMPLWDAGVAKSRETAARANLRAAAANLEQIKKDVATDVEAAFLDYVSALQRVQASIAAVRAADANVQATTERFRLGAAGVTVVNLVAAQVAFFDNNRSLIDAKYDVTLRQADIDRAIGKAE